MPLALFQLSEPPTRDGVLLHDRRSDEMASRPLEIVFVHGAFSEGSYWRKVMRILVASGFRTSAAQVNVQGFAADVIALRHHLDARADIDVILVGHSYGGALISEVAANNSQIMGLVYVAAVAPIAGVPFGVWMAEHPNSHQTTPTLDGCGLLWLSPDDCINGLAHDLPEEDGLLLWAVQKPVAAASFGDSASLEGGRDKPCWYLVTENDRAFSVDGQYELAKQMNATTRSVASGHMVALSHPETVADLVREAIASLELTNAQLD